MTWDWRLETEAGSFLFGDDDSPVVVQEWSATPESLRLADFNNPRGDGVRFGSDLRAGQRISFSVWVNASNEDDATQAMSEMARMWRNDRSRFRGGSVARLVHPRGRAVYGRPRDASFDARRVERGEITGALAFDCVDDLWYGSESVTEVRFVPPAGGGLTFLAEAPFTFDSGPTVRNGAVTVGGDVASWPVFEIHGPVTNPVVEIVGAGKLMFDTTLAYDQVLEVDTRPWARWVKRDGAAFPGALSPAGDRLADMSLTPGAHQVVLRGHDPTGTSFLRVRVASAFTSF